MSVSLTLGQGLTIGTGITFGAGTGGGGPSFSISSSDFTTISSGYGLEGDNTGFNIGGSYGATQACYIPILNASGGGNATKSAEIQAFWNNNGLSTSSSYMFEVSWGPGTSTNTTRNVAVVMFNYSNVDDCYLIIGVVDTNVTGWDTPGQNPYQIQAANGSFMLPATFTLIQPTIQDTYSWC